MMILSSTAFSQLVISAAHTPYCMPASQAIKVVVNLLELNSLRSERPLLATNLQLFEQYRNQAVKRTAADSLLINTQQAELKDVKNRRLTASIAMQLFHADRAKHYRRQRNLAIVLGMMARATVTTILIRTGHPP